MHPFCTMVPIFLLIFFIKLTYGQSVQVVTVGDSGSFFDPPVVIAKAGDMITFQWTGMFHSVTQSTFADPCIPLVGGFDSGVTGNPPLMLTIPEWNLTITDDTKPIWFHCKATRPTSHCANGMVGAINAVLHGTNQSFDNFLQAAKSVTNFSTPSSTVVDKPILTGIGAFATTAPIPSQNKTNTTTSVNSSTSTSSHKISSTSSSTHSATATAAASSSGLTTVAKAGIAGGIVGGAIIVILIVLLFMSYRRGRRYRKEATANISSLHSKPSRDMSNLSRPELLYGITRGQPHSPPMEEPAIDIHARSPPSVTDSLDRDSTAGPSVNIKELAAEIAKNMRQEMLQERSRQPQDVPGLFPVPEQMVASAVTRAESARAESARSESVRTGRQLPRPPPVNKRGDDTISVDTLPLYVSGQNR